MLLNKHYYGVRSSKDIPKYDLGFNYFSSSSNTEFILDQKANKANYKYKVIKIYNNRQEAMLLEIKLHEKFNVGINKNFYNLVKATSKSFDFAGVKHKEASKKKMSDSKRGKPLSKEHKQKISKSLIGKTQTEETKEKISKANSNKCFSDEHKEKISKSITGRSLTEEHKENISYSVSGEKNGFYGKTHTKESKEKISKSSIGKIISEEHKQKISKKMSLDKHPMAKIINIYDSNHNLIFTTHGNFKHFCKECNLPFQPLKDSYQNNGSPIFKSNRSKILAKKKDQELYIGWYAIILPLIQII